VTFGRRQMPLLIRFRIDDQPIVDRMGPRFVGREKYDNTVRQPIGNNHL
jgi:hypothetical protein